MKNSNLHTQTNKSVNLSYLKTHENLGLYALINNILTHIPRVMDICTHRCVHLPRHVRIHARTLTHTHTHTNYIRYILNYLYIFVTHFF